MDWTPQGWLKILATFMVVMTSLVAAASPETKTFQLDISNLGAYYTVSFGLGSPAQQFSVQIDTGSSDFWVQGIDNPYCQGSPNSSVSEVDQFNCQAEGGLFNPQKSSSYKALNSDFDIVYADNSFAQGSLVSDTLSFGVSQEAQFLSIPNSVFGLADNANSSIPVIGLGYKQLETASQQYDNLPILLQKQGVINSRAYSVYLNDVNAANGNILFGGVDKAKYTGPLVTVPLVNLYPAQFSNPVEFTVNATEIKYYEDDCSEPEVINDIPMVPLLDTGTSGMALLNSTVSAIIDKIGYQYNDQAQDYVGHCNGYSIEQKFLTFQISSQIIKVPLSRFVYEASNTQGVPLFFGDGEPVCQLGISVTDDPTLVTFGDTFLRNAYVVFDLDNYQISIAQSTLNQQYSDIEEISAGSNGVPGAVDYLQFSANQLFCSTTTQVPEITSTLIPSEQPTTSLPTIKPNSSTDSHFKGSSTVISPVFTDTSSSRSPVFSGSSVTEHWSKSTKVAYSTRTGTHACHSGHGPQIVGIKSIPSQSPKLITLEIASVSSSQALSSIITLELASVFSSQVLSPTTLPSSTNLFEQNSSSIETGTGNVSIASILPQVNGAIKGIQRMPWMIAPGIFALICLCILI